MWYLAQNTDIVKLCAILHYIKHTGITLSLDINYKCTKLNVRLDWKTTEERFTVLAWE